VDPKLLVPTPDILPAPWWFFYLLSTLTFTLHIILANILVGGGLFLLWGYLRGSLSPEEEALHREAGRIMPLVMAFTINLGVPPLLFLQVMYGQFIYVSSVLMAVPWLSIFVLLIIAYYGLYLYYYKFGKLGSARGWVLGVSVFLMLAVGFLYTNSLLLMIDPDAWPNYFKHPGGTTLHLNEPTLIPRYLHFLVSSFALGGLAVSLLAWWRARKGESGWETVSGKGLVVFGVATIFQFVIGGWYLGGLPSEALSKIFLESKVAFPVFFVAIMVGFASIFFAFNNMPWHTAACAFLTILLMVIFRNAVRGAYLQPYMSLYEPEVSTQFGAAAMFVLALALGIGTLVYLSKLALRSGREP